MTIETRTPDEIAWSAHCDAIAAGATEAEAQAAYNAAWTAADDAACDAAIEATRAARRERETAEIAARVIRRFDEDRADAEAWSAWRSAWHR